ncbi:sugar porter family MFS transporter [Pedobacter caeni]|uniref:MFS transporter, sugar porter (SP) family n=1 Tax=Pedobacter caeni TaxID=288992 RepID=A0A1M5KTK7_9SPHI|nr:sugar porter family MFS transporter [Pedobacter caeni]SHG55849.1 MFS transporter, sugar porter (SP) family [Pedobacter caeni]
MQQFKTSYLLSISFISALGGYLFGFDFAVISGALPFLRDQFGLNEYWEGFATGSLALGAIIGCLTAGRVADKYGRKPGLFIAALIFGLSSLAMAFASGLGVFITARFVAGIGVGMASLLSPMYIAEVSPAQYRGRMVSINQLTIVLGILITNVINYSLRNSGPDAWRWMFGLGAVPSALFVLGVIWLPESPRWLLKAGKEAQGRKVLEKIGGTDFSDSSMDLIKLSLKGNQQLSYKAVFAKAVFPAVMIGIVLAVFQQLCGINVVFNYPSNIFASIGASKDDQLLQTVFIGGVNLFFTLLAMVLVDKIGRRPLMLFGAAALAVLYVVIAQLLSIHSALVGVFLLAAIGTYAISLGPVTWVLISEIFPNHVRGAASSIAVLCLWAAYFILTFTFPVLAKWIGMHNTFYLYSGICMLGFLFIKAKVRETNGKTLEELESVFSPH